MRWGCDGGVMGDMKSYRDLEVYQLAHKVGVELHSFTFGRKWS